MPSLTPAFRRYVEVVQETQDEMISTPNPKSPKKFVVEDTFVEECRILLRLVLQLEHTIKDMQKEYLNSFKLTEPEKDEIDMEIRLQLQEYLKKFKFLQKYEQHREELLNKQYKNALFDTDSHSLSVWDRFLQPESEEAVVYHKSNNTFRTGVLQSLNLWIRRVSSLFNDIQQERLASQVKFSIPSISTNPLSPTDGVSPPSPELTVTTSQPTESLQEEVKHYEETVSMLNQDQIQILESEHLELLNEKNSQLAQVEKISKTIMDIVSMQTELATHLQVQSQNINSILDNQEDIEVNIAKGNKELNQAQRAAGRTAKLTKYLAVLMGIILLLLDYIN